MLRRSLACLLTCLALTGLASACSIPVFRYALERWRPDPYEVLVFHRGALSDAHEDLLQQLAPEYVPGEPFPNAMVTRVDLDGNVRPEFNAIWQTESNATLPWIVVRTPWKGENQTVWTGALTAESVRAIHVSPLRAELIKRLVAGESVVFVFVEGKDAPASETAFQFCQQELNRLQKALSLPDIKPEDLADLSVPPDQLGLRFSLLRTRRDNPEERLLVNALLTVQPHLKDAVAAGEPMLFPVFGRGRALFPLVGGALTAQNLEDLAAFLCGACQCTIKQQNPGVDLLTAVDWEAYVLGTPTERPLPPLTGLAGFTSTSADPAAELEPALPPSEAAAQPDAASPPAETAPPVAAATVPATTAESASVGEPVLWTAIGLTVLVVIISLASTRRGA